MNELVRPLGRWLGRLTAAMAALAAAIVLGYTLYAVSALPPLQPWHSEILGEEFSAWRDRDLDFAGYQQLEGRLFAELDSTVSAWKRDDEAFLHSRFNPAGAPLRLAAGAPFNRSFRLTPAAPRGGALLLHGLTDSPYSMKALADTLYSRGFEVTVLRMPGHGTLPSMMTTASLADWTAAVRLAARDVAARTPAGQPYYIGGYSTGGTLALLHTLATLEDPALRRPDRVLLISPAISLTPVAVLAEMIDILAVLPVPVFDKVHWQEVAPEFDPYKFNSFPVNASRQVKRATRALASALGSAGTAGRLARMPPVVTWQSVVDSTVGAVGVVEVLYSRLQGPAHRLVMFDVNRQQALQSVVRPSARALLEGLQGGALGSTLDVVTAPDPQSHRVSVLRRMPGAAQTARQTTLDWPSGLVSLGHVALPFPPDDPIYGFVAGSGHGGLPSIGSLLLRGEGGALTVSLGSLTRLRSNPFWTLIDEDVASMAAADIDAAAARVVR
jgi:alpha-beta hydrolase superfamily lysophospholipase